MRACLSDCSDTECRAGLSARSGQSDQAQVIMEMGQGYDMDQEIEGLSSSVSRLKQVCLLVCRPCLVSKHASISSVASISSWNCVKA